jgi:hypothetical protein
VQARAKKGDAGRGQSLLIESAARGRPASRRIASPSRCLLRATSPGNGDDGVPCPASRLVPIGFRTIPIRRRFSIGLIAVPIRWCFLKARDGDWELLALYLESGEPVTPDIRKFLSEVLRGDRKRPKNRHHLASTVTREMEIAEFVMKQEDAGKCRGVIAEAEKKFRCTRSTVQRALKKHRMSLLLLGRRLGSFTS